MAIVNTINSILSIFIMIFIAYYLTDKSWFNKKTADIFSKIIINISLPSLLIYNLLTSFSKSDLLDMWKSLLIPLTGLIISYLLSKILAKIIGIEKNQRGVFSALFTFSNTVFIGMPVNLAFFGEKGVSIAMIYYIAHTTFFWTVGVYGIKKDRGDFEHKLFSLENIKNMISPALIAYLFANLLIFFELNLAKFLLDTANYLSKMTTPLSMFFLGITIYFIEFKNIKFNKKLITLLLGTFVLTPAAVYFSVYIFGSSELIKKVFIIEAAMPVMATTPIVVKAYGKNHEYAALIVGLTTALSLISIPVSLLCLSLFI